VVLGKNGPYFFDLGKSIAPLELLKIVGIAENNQHLSGDIAW